MGSLRCNWLSDIDLCRLHWRHSEFDDALEAKLGYTIDLWEGECPFEGKELECPAYNKFEEYEGGRPMKCPLSAVHRVDAKGLIHFEQVECSKPDCAWWDVEPQQCSIRALRR